MVIDNAKLEGVQNLTLLAVMSSSRYRWYVTVKQFPSNSCENLNISTVSTQIAPSTDPVYTKDAYGDVKGANALNHAESGRPRRSLDEEPSLTPFVINGQDSILGKLPWQASLRSLSVGTNRQDGRECSVSEGIHTCGGSIISRREILTAAHCVLLGARATAAFPIQFMRIFVGDINKCEDENEEASQAVQVLKVESITVHYNYERVVMMNDVAIIRLKTDIKFNENVQPIKMASTGNVFHECLTSKFY